MICPLPGLDHQPKKAMWPADVLKLKHTDIRDGALWIVQNKTGARLGIDITGELATTIARINERPRKAISA